MTYPRYPDYKDSGVEWLGEVPAHWRSVPLKHLVRLTSGGTPSKENEDFWNGDVPWASAKDLKTDFLYDTEDHLTEYAIEQGAASLLDTGSVLIVVRGMILARTFPVTLTRAPIAINQDLKGIVAEKDIIPEFIAWYLRGTADETLRRLDEAGHGTKALRMDAWTSLTVAVPPLTEQSAIVTFLDRKTAKIDVLVAEQQRLIELLKEKRQAVISHAVTKGLNPDAPMKDSGIEWLGAVPEHWTVIALGRVTIDRCDGPFGSGLKSDHYTDQGVRVVRLQNIRANGFDNSDSAYINTDYYNNELSDHDVCGGDLLIAGLGDERNAVGRACVAPNDIAPAMVKADCFRFRLAVERTVPAFTALQLTAGSTADAGAMATGTTRSRIPLSVMASRKIAFPPLPEQTAIVAYLDDQTAKIDALIAEAERAIELLKEHRSALISAAVTGKIDVRGLVASIETTTENAA